MTNGLASRHATARALALRRLEGRPLTGVACKSCGQQNPPDARFCLACGTAVSLACGECGAQLPAGARFCVACGRPVVQRVPASYTPADLRDRMLAVRRSVEGERKRVTVLFCDVVRSTSLGRDLGPERLRRVVEQFFTA